MFKWTQFPFIRLSAALIIGILIGDLFLLDWRVISASIFLFSLLFIVFANYQQLILSGICGLIAVAFIGMLKVNTVDVNENQNHLLKLKKQPTIYGGIVVSERSERENFNRYEFQLESGFYAEADSSIPIKGSVYLYVRKGTNDNYSPGNKLFIADRINWIKAPGNPHVFDYQTFLHYKGIYGQFFTDSSSIHQAGERSLGIHREISIEARSFLSTIFENRIRQEREREILNALTLGIKDSLDEDLKSAYASAGIMHILAVSGLHVGIIYLMVSTILSKFLKGKKYAPVRVSLLILLLFSFAVITGLTASVLRAAVMFSIIACRELIGRKSSIYNSLGIAAFILLLINPYFVYDVGFQLSFIAVFGIVLLQPFIYDLLSVENIVLEKIWSLSSVSLAAQIATAPLSIYYFHQFPTYFLITNLFAIPAAFVMLTGGMLLWILELIYFPVAIGYAYLLENFIGYFNEFILLFKNLPIHTIDNLFLGGTDVFLIFGAMLFIGIAAYYRSFFTLIFGIILITCLQANFHFRAIEQKKQNLLIIYQLKNHLLIDHMVGNRLTEYRIDAEDIAKEIQYQVSPFRLARGISEPANDHILLEKEKEFLELPGKGEKQSMILQGNVSLYQGTSIVVDNIILTGKISDSLQEIKRLIEFQNIVIAPDIPFWQVKMWREEAATMGITVHEVSKDGFWMLDLS